MSRRATLLWSCALAALLVGALAVFWLSGQSPDDPAGSGLEPDLVAGPYRLAARLDPETPRVGDNVLTLLLRDAEGRPVRGASITAVAEMPAMGAMPAMRAPAEMGELEPGLYRGTFAPSMAGSWPLTLRITHESAGAAQLTFDLATGRRGLRPASGVRPLDGPEGAPVADGSEGMAGSADATGAAPESAADAGEDADGSVFQVDASWQQAIGVRTAPVERRPLRATLRLPGRVVVDENRLVDVNLRMSGWIERLLVAETGQRVSAGQPLFELYSPELVTAQQDLLLALETVGRLADSPSAEARERAASLAEASRRRLLRLGLQPDQVAAVVERGELWETLPVLAPAGGYVLEKMAIQGMRVEPGMRLYRIADLSVVWVLVDVYEGDASFVRPGQPARFRLSYEPERLWRGRVDYVYPTLEADTRSVQVRLVFDNPRLELRPEMYGDVVLESETAPRPAIPAEAVLELGTRNVVFVDLGDGRLQAREVALGPQAGGWYPVRAGLQEGEVVVVSGNFLIDAESKVRGIVPLPLESGPGGDR